MNASIVEPYTTATAIVIVGVSKRTIGPALRQHAQTKKIKQNKGDNIHLATKRLAINNQTHAKQPTQPRLSAAHRQRRQSK